MLVYNKNMNVPEILCVNIGPGAKLLYITLPKKKKEEDYKLIFFFSACS